jgi:small subunit ribosomal protein S18
MRRDLLRVRRARWVDYKNLPLLTRYLSNFARILPRRLTGATQKHQRMVEQALKRARYLALMPYTLQHLMPEGKGPK